MHNASRMKAPPPTLKSKTISSILWSVVARALRYMTAGLAFGVLSAWVLGRFVEGFLFEVRPHDPAVYGGVIALLTLTGLAAALVPARRAARVDPLIAIRME